MTVEEEIDIQYLEWFEKQDRINVSEINRKTEFLLNVAIKRRQYLESNGYIILTDSNLNPEFSFYYRSNTGKRYYELLLKKIDDEKKAEEKLMWDSKISKLQAKTFWPIFWLGVVGGLCGLISLIWELAR